MVVKGNVICANRKAYHDYYIEETIEAGIVLTGTEIKSIRAGKISLQDSYARPKDGEIWLHNSQIARYKEGNIQNHEVGRPRKLLLNKKEIRHLEREAVQKGYNLVPLRVYFKKGNAKLALGLGKGKRVYDKRRTIAQRDVERELSREVKTSR